MNNSSFPNHSSLDRTPLGGLSLYELNRLVGEVVALELSDEYWVEAELSEAREVRGHCYMELVQKDPFEATPIARASAKCWKNTWTKLRPKFEQTTGQQLHSGMKVLLRVYANFHEAYGFSWIVTDINPEYTMGDMARRRQEIIRQLKAEGVFDMQRELTLPLFLQRVAVVSSATAAGYGDFCNQLADNPYGFPHPGKDSHRRCSPAHRPPEDRARRHQRRPRTNSTLSTAETDFS